LKTGKGSGDLPSIPGVTDLGIADDYTAAKPYEVAAPQTVADRMQTDAVAPAEQAAAPEKGGGLFSGMMVIGLAIGLLASPYLARKFKGMSASEIIAYIFEMTMNFINTVIKLIKSLLDSNKALPHNK
jgi:predicted lipid-binding transport protein (Tim44 family)